MKRQFIVAAALCSFFSLAAFAQTPAPRNTAAPATAGGLGAEGKIAIVNTSAFSSNILELKAKLEGLQSEFDPKRKEVEAVQNKINNLKNQIQNQGSTVNASTRDKWVEEGTEAEKNLKRMVEDYEALAKKRGDEVTTPIYTKIGNFLQQYAQQKGIAMVVDGVAAQQNSILLWAAPTTDITEDFIKEYNKANPAPAGGAKK